MTTLAHNIARYMREAGLSEAQLAQKAAIGQPVLNKILSGKTRNPKISTLLSIAHYLKISVNQLMHDANDPAGKVLIADSTKIPILTRSEVLDWFSPQKAPHLSPQSTVFVDTPLLRPRSFAIRLEDMSMAPRFPKDTLCIITPECTPQDQDFVVAHLKGSSQVIFKQFWTDGTQPYLRATQQDFPPIAITPQHRILGIMIQARITLHRPTDYDDYT